MKIEVKEKIKEFNQLIKLINNITFETNIFINNDSIFIKATDDSNIMMVQLTIDKDFGELVFLEERLSKGVILLRTEPQTLDKVNHQLQRLIEKHSERQLQKLFCVIEENRYRIRRLSNL